MAVPDLFLNAKYALLHGDDSDGRLEAVNAWKGRHLSAEWEDFSLITCPEGCQWPVVNNALHETAPFGVDRVVVVPHADNLLEKAKELPPSIKKILANPIDGTCLLLVAREALSATPGKILSAKPFIDWKNEGRVLKVGELDSKSAVVFLEAKAKELKLRLEIGVAKGLADQLGGNPGILARAMEVLELVAEDGKITRNLLESATFRLGEQSAFAWSQAWQKGQLRDAIIALRSAIEDDPEGAPLMLLGQARKEVERLCRLHEAKARGLRTVAEFSAVLGLTPKQSFLIDGYSRVLERIRMDGLKQLAALMVDADSDIKGGTLSKSPTPLINLTMSLCRAWGGR
ncbi:MAG: DNA polymerase III subunit delta [Holophagaceae bacterium]|nr:DNA polymerase III subunit delta [Holophagaceae bacterium]